MWEFDKKDFLQPVQSPVFHTWNTGKKFLNRDKEELSCCRVHRMLVSALVPLSLGSGGSPAYVLLTLEVRAELGNANFSSLQHNVALPWVRLQLTEFTLFLFQRVQGLPLWIWGPQLCTCSAAPVVTEIYFGFPLSHLSSFFTVLIYTKQNCSQLVFINCMGLKLEWIPFSYIKKNCCWVTVSEEENSKDNTMHYQVRNDLMPYPKYQLLHLHTHIRLQKSYNWLL